MDVFLILSILVLAILLAASFRIAGEDERFIVTTLGRFRRLHGPGLGLMLIGFDRWQRVRIGDSGVYRGERLAEFSGTVAPVEMSDGKPDDAVRINSFRDGKIWTTVAASNFFVCQKCGHENPVGA